MAPPRRCTAQSHEPGGLGRHAVGRHELLLLADRVEKVQSVRPEPNQPERHERHEAEGRGAHDPHPLASAAGGEHEEGQHEPGRDLDRDAGRQRDRGRAEAWVGPRRERQRGREQHDDERVIVGAARGQHEEHRVQANERGRPAGRLTEPARSPGDERDRAEARGDRDRLERPQPAGDAERRGGVARDREKRTVGGVQEGPSDESEYGVGGHFGGDVRVGVKSVECSEPGEAQVPEHILGDERRTQQQDQVRGEDRRHQAADVQLSRRQQNEQVARGHDQHQRLEAAVGDTDVEPFQGARHPAGPATTAPGNVMRGCRGGAGAQKEDGRDDAEQAKGAYRPDGARPSACAPRRFDALVRSCGCLQPGCGGRALY
jgi:hypothetical protein